MASPVQGQVQAEGDVPVHVLAQQLAQLFTQHPLSCDLQISAFAAALLHYRRASVAAPFPTELFNKRGTDGLQQKDYEAAQRAMDAVLPVDQMSSPAAVMQPQALQLLAWLLMPRTRRRLMFKPVTMVEFAQHLQRVQPGVRPPAFPVTQSPTFLFQNVPEQGQVPAQFGRPVVAYHGTCMENLHSIMNTGLINMSGTRMQRTGAIFGEGVYLSTDYGVAFSFSQPSYIWRHSNLGYKTRCLLVCEVDMDKVEPAEEAEKGAAQGAGEAAGSAGSAAAGSSSDPHGPAGGQVQKGLPESYLLVKRGDAIRLLYVLIYTDARMPPPSTARRWNICTVLVVLYVLAMLVHWASNDRMLRYHIRQYWRHLKYGDTSW